MPGGASRETRPAECYVASWPFPQALPNLLPGDVALRRGVRGREPALQLLLVPVRHRQVVCRIGDAIPELGDQVQLLGRGQLVEIEVWQRLRHRVASRLTLLRITAPYASARAWRSCFLRSDSFR